MFKQAGKWLVYGSIGLFFSVGAHAAVFQVSDSMTGPSLQTKTYAFNISSIGIYQASLVDNGFPAPFAAMLLGISQSGGPLLGSISHAGSFNFNATQSGAYTALFFGAPGPFSIGPFTANGSSYGITVAAVPEPEVWAMMLIGVGLIGYQLRRKSKAGPVKIAA
jgi:hypothetical protein